MLRSGSDGFVQPEVDRLRAREITIASADADCYEAHLEAVTLPRVFAAQTEALDEYGDAVRELRARVG